MSSASAGRIKGVLFDKDGTLIDLHVSWVSAGLATGERLCAMAGRPAAFEPLLRESGYDPVSGRLDPRSRWAAGTTETLVRDWIARLELPGGEALVADMLVFMTERASARVAPLADLPVLFESLTVQGVRLGVATMDLESSARGALSRLRVLDALDFVCGCDSGHGEKPGPGMALAFCRACGLSPHEVMVVGDTPHDMHMARAAGVAKAVAVTSGAAGAELLAGLADHVIDDVSGLLALLRPAAPLEGLDR